MAKNKKGYGVHSDGVGVRGFYRLQINNQDGRVAGDSGWRENTVVNLGFQDYLAATLGAVAGSKQITYAMLGSGTAPGATATALDGEYTDVATARCAVTPTTIASKTVQFAFTLASSVYTAAKTIQNVGLINHSSTATAGTIFSGNTYTTSALATNQSVNGLITWPLRLAIIVSKSLKLQEQLNKIKSICSEILEGFKKTFNDYNRGHQLVHGIV